MKKNWFEGKLPDRWFSNPDKVKVSAEALAIAKGFDEEISGKHPDQQWVIAFDWADSRRVRDRGTNNWQDLGSGLDLTAYEHWKVPLQAIKKLDELRYAIKIPDQILDASAEKLVDVDDSSVSGLVLK